MRNRFTFYLFLLFCVAFVFDLRAQYQQQAVYPVPTHYGYSYVGYFAGPFQAPSTDSCNECLAKCTGTQEECAKECESECGGVENGRIVFAVRNNNRGCAECLATCTGTQEECAKECESECGGTERSSMLHFLFNHRHQMLSPSPRAAMNLGTLPKAAPTFNEPMAPNGSVAYSYGYGTTAQHESVFAYGSPITYGQVVNYGAACGNVYSFEPPIASPCYQPFPCGGCYVQPWQPVHGCCFSGR